MGQICSLTTAVVNTKVSIRRRGQITWPQHLVRSNKCQASNGSLACFGLLCHHQATLLAYSIVSLSYVPAHVNYFLLVQYIIILKDILNQIAPPLTHTPTWPYKRRTAPQLLGDSLTSTPMAKCSVFNRFHRLQVIYLLANLLQQGHLNNYFIFQRS